VKISNPRDLTVQLLGELLYVERRLADRVLVDLTDGIHDPGLAGLVRAHRDETAMHAERVEGAFLAVGVTPSSHRSAPFEAAVTQHDELVPAIVDRELADRFHAQAALHTEHWEIAAYETLLRIAPFEVTERIAPSLGEELTAADGLRAWLEA
jgi:ferritin-like metal-binding protein YciE